MNSSHPQFLSVKIFLFAFFYLKDPERHDERFYLFHHHLLLKLHDTLLPFPMSRVVLRVLMLTKIIFKIFFKVFPHVKAAVQGLREFANKTVDHELLQVKNKTNFEKYIP